MADSLTPERRSWNMAQIRGKNTKPEIIVRSLLHHLGYRFTINASNNKKLPGRPDIVLPKYKTAVFVHGCYWHRHPGCKYAYNPKSRIEFWQKKFEENVERDTRQMIELRQMEWQVEIVWECETKTDAALQAVAERILKELPIETEDKKKRSRRAAEKAARYRAR